MCHAGCHAGCHDGRVRLYLDSADRDTVVDLLATGLFRGVTTNPTILQRAGLGAQQIPEVYRWAVDAGSREVFIQSWGSSVAELLDRGLRLRDLGPEVVVKVPVSREGAAVCARLNARGIPTLLTAVYHPGQAMIAAAAGATYLAPYLGRLDDHGRDGLGTVRAMQELLDSDGGLTQILLASIRDVDSMVAAARFGVRCFTFGTAVAETFFADELTAAAVADFEAAAAATTPERLG